MGTRRWLIMVTSQTNDDRNLLRTFRLPGEAQKIDRVMNEFAQKYCGDNPKIFSTTDTAYILAYSLIMLNTDAHNPNVKKKMSLHDFLRNNRGWSLDSIGDGRPTHSPHLTHPLISSPPSPTPPSIGIDNRQDLPEDFMKKLYLNIVNNEIKMNEHDNVFQVRELCSMITGIPSKPEVYNPFTS